MTRGLTRSQLGVTEQMIQTYGDVVWDLSHNVQVRRGDPVRLLDWEQIEAQREGTGMADVEIAARIGLTREQVTFIRVALERRRFRRESYHRLLELGGGRRFRADRFTAPEDRFAFRDEALALRETLDFDPRDATRYVRSGLWRNDTVGAWLLRNAAAAPERPAIVGPESRLSYGDALQRARALAGGLANLGLKRGDVIALHLDDGPDAVVAWFAVTLLGAVACPLRPAGNAAEDSALLRNLHVRGIICRADLADPIVESVDTLRHVVVTGADAPGGAHSAEGLIASGVAPPEDAAPVASDPAVLLRADAGGDALRATLHNHHTLLSPLPALARELGLRDGEGIETTAPLAHPLGLWAASLALCICGPISFATAARQFDRTTDAANPALLILPAADAKAIGDRALPSPRLALVEGASVSVDVCKTLQARLPGATVGRMWCPAETLAALVTVPATDRETRYGSAGSATPGMEVRVVAQDGATLDAESDGELQLRGCGLAPGYAGDAAARRNAFTGDGWWRTGLTARLMPDRSVRFAADATEGRQSVAI